MPTKSRHPLFREKDKRPYREMVSADHVDPEFDDLEGAELDLREEFGHFADDN